MRRVLLVFAIGAALAGTATAATIRGTALGELLRGGEASDRIVARAGDDRIQVAFGGRDRVACGAGRDLVVADRQDAVAGDCETVVRRLSVDPFRNPGSQHETAAEPDSFAWGATVVAAFQLGRFAEGAASGIGFATSRDAGRTWRNGSLPALTVESKPPGQWSRASDPSVAYDAAHGIWLVSSLTLTPGTSGIVVSRSRDGVQWSAPVSVVEGPTLDKEWIACDNGAASRFRGRCYAVYTDDALHLVALQSSDDGGLSWTAAVTVVDSELIGAQPAISPDGTLTVLLADLPHADAGTIVAVRSTDGGATFARPTVVSSVQWVTTERMRAIPLPSTAVDAAGTIFVAWHDCRFRPGCTANDIVVASSRDGIAWTGATRLAVDRLDSRSDHFITGLDADPTARGRLAVVYAFFAPGSCAPGPCRLEIGFSSSVDGGTTWSRQQRLDAQPIPVDWLAQTTSGAMVGDYFSTSFAAGRAVPVFALALPPLRGRVREAIFATSLAVGPGARTS